MKIVLDLRSIRQPESGDGQFSLNLIEALAKIDTRNKYMLFLLPQTEHFFKFSNNNFKARVLSIKPYSLREQFLIPRIVREEGVDLFHSFTYVMPYSLDCPSILNIYDVIHILFRQNYPLKLRLYYEFIVKRCVRKVNKILTLSEYSKTDITKHLGVDWDKIIVIYCGCSKRFFPMDKTLVRERLKQDYNLNGRFLLYVGNMRPHKNIATLLSAFRRCLDKISDLKLVICAKKQFSFKNIEENVNSLNLGKSVRFLDSIDDKTLPLLYNAASVFVFPSLYEGFGLPPLEAIACGTPVISSNRAALPEILGDAAIWVNPQDIERLTCAIIDILSNSSRAEYLAKLGIERSRLFSWDKSAWELLNLYEDVVRTAI